MNVHRDYEFAFAIYPISLGDVRVAFLLVLCYISNAYTNSAVVCPYFNVGCFVFFLSLFPLFFPRSSLPVPSSNISHSVLRIKHNPTYLSSFLQTEHLLLHLPPDASTSQLVTSGSPGSLRHSLPGSHASAVQVLLRATRRATTRHFLRHSSPVEDLLRATATIIESIFLRESLFQRRFHSRRR